MKTGRDRQRWNPAAHPRAQSGPDTSDVPSALYTLRAIVLGVAAVIGTIGVLAFVRVPDSVPSPAQAAAGARLSDLASRTNCGEPCLGRAVAVQEVDVLPGGLEAARALGVVTRAETEAPMAATPPPDWGHRRDEGDGETTHHDEEQTERKGGKVEAKGENDRDRHEGHGRDRDNEDKQDKRDKDDDHDD